MRQLTVRYFEIDETQRRADRVDAAFDILFEQVFRDHAPPWVGAKATR